MGNSDWKGEEGRKAKIFLKVTLGDAVFQTLSSPSIQYLLVSWSYQSLDLTDSTSFNVSDPSLLSRYTVPIGGGAGGGSALTLTQTTTVASYLLTSLVTSPPSYPSLKPEPSF